MSMRSSFIYGYGFNCDCEDVNLIEFLKAHKDAFCQSVKESQLYNDMLKYTEKDYDLEDFFQCYACENTGIEGSGAVIANIMSRETGIRFIYCMPDGDCNTLASVVFEQSYPWQLNDIEKALTEDDVQKICQRYMDELGIAESPTYLELEYWG